MPAPASAPPPRRDRRLRRVAWPAAGRCLAKRYRGEPVCLRCKHGFGEIY